MESLHQDEIRKLEDKDLQLRYILGGLYPHGSQNCLTYWNCIRCATLGVEDDERLQQVKEFIEKHNISNATFLILARTYQRGSFVDYKGSLGELISELATIFEVYQFPCVVDETPKISSLKEKELLELVAQGLDNEASRLGQFLRKYDLSVADFMVLAKTSINASFRKISSFTDENFDLRKELVDLLNEANMYVSMEELEAYRKSLTSKEVEEEPKDGSLMRRIRDKFSKKRN